MADPAVPANSATDQDLAMWGYQQKEATTDCRNRLTYAGRLEGAVK